MAEFAPLALLEGYGVELEYMIVDSATLDVRPIADQLIAAELGHIENELERGAFAWSNELARHVIELKTNGPTSDLCGLAQGFAGEIARIDELLSPLGARLLPTAMHPWMEPAREFEIWPHGDRMIYQAFDRIFDCRGHGWSNLQSAHLNLSFGDDEEFGRLHAAARALLPLLPAIAAASPFIEGRHPGTLDTRLDVYRSNARRVPSVSGSVIPEPLFKRASYEEMLGVIYTDLEPFDREGLLRHEWVNARGCIARFDRMAVEIRVLDVQECPQADLAIAALVSRVIRSLCDPGGGTQERLRSLETGQLASILRLTISDGEQARIEDPAYLTALGVPGSARTAQELWCSLAEREIARAPDAIAEYLPAIELLLSEGPLARRILRRIGSAPTRDALKRGYRELADCLREGKLFRAGT